MAWTEIKGPQGSRRVRVFIERPGESLDGPVGLADCERVNERLSTLLDLEDPIPGSYVLEVSTPGLDRPLGSTDDARRFLGRRVRVRFRTEARTRTLVGTLAGAEAGEIRIAGIAGEPEDGVRIPWDAVLGARLAPDFDVLFGAKSPQAGNRSRRGIRRGRQGRG